MSAFNDPFHFDPTSYHADLTIDRLTEVGLAMEAANNSAFARAEPLAGDDGWSIGCTAYSRVRHAIRRIGELHPDWLEVEAPGLEFVFRIGQVPLRFCHDDAEQLGVRHRLAFGIERQARERFIQQPLAFTEGMDGVLRLVLERQESGALARLVLLLISEHGATLKRRVLLDRSQPTVLPQADDLARPDVELRAREADHQRIDDGTDG